MDRNLSSNKLPKTEAALFHSLVFFEGSTVSAMNLKIFIFASFFHGFQSSVFSGQVKKLYKPVHFKGN